ncbi:MAG: ankyrin repeat domain-containing protein [Alkalispirochaeta sp.]
MKIMSRLALLVAVLSLTSCISMIHRSVDRNDLAAVREEVNAGVPVESTDYRDKTPLLMAAEQGRMEIVRYLVEEAGADVNATTPDSRGEITPLRYAIENEDYEMVRFLVQNGADVNKANRAGWTPIMTAARTGNREILQYLLQEGADLRARTADGTTPVRVASNNGWTDIVVWMTMLLERDES